MPKEEQSGLLAVVAVIDANCSGGYIDVHWRGGF